MPNFFPVFVDITVTTGTYFNSSLLLKKKASIKSFCCLFWTLIIVWKSYICLRCCCCWFSIICMKFYCFFHSTSSCCLLTPTLVFAFPVPLKKFSASLPLDLFFFFFPSLSPSSAFLFCICPSLSIAFFRTLSAFSLLDCCWLSSDSQQLSAQSRLHLLSKSAPLVPFQLLSDQFRFQFLFLLFSTYFSTILKVGCNDLGLPTCQL